MIVEHYICDKCGHDVTYKLDSYVVPMNGNYNETVHLCEECIKLLNDFMNEKVNRK